MIESTCWNCNKITGTIEDNICIECGTIKVRKSGMLTMGEFIDFLNDEDIDEL